MGAGAFSKAISSGCCGSAGVGCASPGSGSCGGDAAGGAAEHAMAAIANMLNRIVIIIPFLFLIGFLISDLFSVVLLLKRFLALVCSIFGPRFLEKLCKGGDCEVE